MALDQITVAAVTPTEVDRIRLFFEELEDVVNDENNDDTDIGIWVTLNYDRIEGAWNRLLFAYETIYENACDPTVRHLEWKPEIKAALELAATAKED